MLFMWVICKGVYGLKFYILLIWILFYGLIRIKYFIICLEEFIYN